MKNDHSDPILSTIAVVLFMAYLLGPGVLWYLGYGQP